MGFDKEQRDRGRTWANHLQFVGSVNDYADIVPDLLVWQERKETLRTIAARLNERGRLTRKGAKWTATQVKRLLDRIDGKLEYVVLNGDTVVARFQSYVDTDLYFSAKCREDLTIEIRWVETGWPTRTPAEPEKQEEPVKLTDEFDGLSRAMRRRRQK
jgi:hypothetical protein